MGHSRANSKTQSTLNPAGIKAEIKTTFLQKAGIFLN